jgi:tetratricopeptide (TPR) repeat protein
MGEKALQATTLAQLAHVLYAQGRFDEARQLIEVIADIGAPDDLSVQVLWRRVRAKIVARDARHEEAERLAREAVALAELTDWPSDRGDALLDLGEVLRAAGRTDEAESSVREAVTLFRAKGNVVSAAKAEALLRGAVPA